jgi:hypothetical protein
MTELLYDDVSNDRFLLQSKKIGDTFLIEVIDLWRKLVIRRHVLPNWNAYSQQYFISKMALPDAAGIEDLQRDIQQLTRSMNYW